eukprot:g14419.t2
MAQTDREALVVLFNATDGLNWKENANWDTHADLSKWYGVQANDQGRVVVLALFSNNLQGPIPSELGNLTALEELRLSGNQLTGPIPEELGKLTALKELYLNGNKLSGAIPAQLGALTKLTWLDLSSNKLDGSIPEELGKLTALKELSLSGNNLSGAIPAQLAALTKLTWLNLSSNKLDGHIPRQLGDLSALQYLSLSENKLDGLWDVLGQKNAKSMAARPALCVPKGALPAALGSLLDMFDRVDRRGGVSLYDNPWEHPPEAIVEGGVLAVRRYFDAIFRDGATTVTRPLKVVIVGKETVGKTSLRCSIKRGKPRMTIEGGVESTVHVDVEDHELDGHPIRMFDCAGQVVYYGLLQLFLTPRAVYLLAWDAAKASKMDALDLEELAIAPWLRYLTFRVPDANVLLVGNKWDEVVKSKEQVEVDVETQSGRWLSAWEEKAHRHKPQRLSLEAGVSLVSCAPSVLRTMASSVGKGTGWPCDRSTPGLFHRIIYNSDGEKRAVTMTLPRSYQLALEMLKELTPSSRGEAQQQTRWITRASLEEKWQAKVDALARVKTPVEAPGEALSGAILIKSWEGGLVEYGSFIFLDVQWFASVLDPLFSHKRDSLGNIDLGGFAVTKNIRSLNRLDKKNILEPKLADELWGAELAPHLLLALESAGLTFPFPDDPNEGLVILLRMDSERPSSYDEDLEDEVKKNKYGLTLQVKCFFRLGLPPGIVERLLARCCHLGYPHPFWRYGALIVGPQRVGQGSFSLTLDYSEREKTLTVEVSGRCGEVDAWAALSKVLSLAIKMLWEFPGLPCEVTFFCPKHKEEGMMVKTTEARPGSRLVQESDFCSRCVDRSAGNDLVAVALQVVDFSDEGFVDARLFEQFAEHAEKVALTGRALWPGLDYEISAPGGSSGQASPQANRSSQDSRTPWYQDLRTWIGAASVACLTVFGVLAGREDDDPRLWGVFLGLAMLLLVVEFVLIAKMNEKFCFRAGGCAGNEPAGDGRV